MHKYKTKTGDTFDSISFDFYGNEKYSSEIIEANLDYIDTIIFDADIELILPEINVIENNNLPPWKVAM